MIEYLLTDLPRYVKTAPRENFANSVVKEGAVLLFRTVPFRKSAPEVPAATHPHLNPTQWRS